MRHCFEQPDLPLRAFRKALGKNRPETLEGGGKGGGSAPQPPDPYAVAGATTQTNEATAAYNKALNLNNYSNPFGSQTSRVVGTDSSGAPIYQTTTAADGTLQNLINGAENSVYAGGLQGYLGNSLFGLGSVNNSIDPAAAQKSGQQGQQAAYAAQTQYLDPQFSQQQTSLESQLANQGLTPGSQAYDNAYKNFSNAKQQAYSNAANTSILTGQQIGSQMLQNELATAGTKANLYGQQASLSQIPYSQLTSLASLVPGNTGTGQSAASPANIGQNIYSNYQGALNNYNAGQSSSNQFMGGLFGLGSSAILGSMMSDRRLKTDVHAIGPVKPGVNLYRYRYLWDAPGVERHGLMADEVRRVQPEAVVRTPSGFDAVNYDRALRG